MVVLSKKNQSLLTVYLGKGDLPININEATEEELLNLAVIVAEQINTIQDQIGEAKEKVFVDGVYSDRSWFQKINGALTAKKTQRRLIDERRQELCRERKKEERQHQLIEEKLSDSNTNLSAENRVMHLAAEALMSPQEYKLFKSLIQSHLEKHHLILTKKRIGQVTLELSEKIQVEFDQEPVASNGQLHH